jgi:hypothetical protein
MRLVVARGGCLIVSGHGEQIIKAVHANATEAGAAI